MVFVTIFLYYCYAAREMQHSIALCAIAVRWSYPRHMLTIAEPVDVSPSCTARADNGSRILAVRSSTSSTVHTTCITTSRSTFCRAHSSFTFPARNTIAATEVESPLPTAPWACQPVSNEQAAASQQEIHSNNNIKKKQRGCCWQGGQSWQQWQ